MKTTTQVFWLSTAFIASSAGVIFMMSRAAPLETGLASIALVYVFIFIAISTIASMFGFTVRRAIWNKSSPFHLLQTAKRQGVMLGLFAVILLYLRANEILNIWTAVSLIVIFALLELYTASR